MSNVYFLRSREDFWVFEEHLRHRQAVQLTAKPRAEFTRLQSQMARLRQINSDVLPLAEELSKARLRVSSLKVASSSGRKRCCGWPMRKTP